MGLMSSYARSTFGSEPHYESDVTTVNDSMVVPDRQTSDV